MGLHLTWADMLANGETTMWKCLKEGVAILHQTYARLSALFDAKCPAELLCGHEIACRQRYVKMQSWVRDIPAQTLNVT